MKCVNEKGCPFLLFNSKDGPWLAVKILNLDHRCCRDFTFPSASHNFLAKHFKNIIYKNPEFRVTDMKTKAEEVLKINVSLYKCKRT